MSNWIQTTDIDNTETNNGMFNDGSGYGVNSASDMSSGFVDNFLDPTGFVKGFYNDVLGFTSQEREFEQQSLMTEKQNKWNSAAAQMERAKAAGINPLTAASGIVGSGSSGVASAAGSATPSSAIGDVIGMPSEMASRASQSDASRAAAEEARSQASKNSAELPWIAPLSHARQMELFGNFAKTITEAGNEEITAGGLAFDLLSGGLQSAVQYLSLFNGLRFKDKEKDRIDADYQLAMKEVDSFDERMQSQLDLNTKQGLYLEKQRLKVQAETAYQNSMNQLVQDLPGIQLPGANGMIYSYFKFGAKSPQFLAYGQGLYDYAYKSQLGSYDARVDTIYDEMYNSAAGAASGNAENEAYLSFLRQNEEWVKQYLSFKFSPDYEVFLSKLSGWIGPEYDEAAKAAEFGRGVPQLKNTLPHYSDYKKK